MQDVAVDVEGILEPLQHQVDDLGDHARIAAIRDDDHELVAAEPAHLGGTRELVGDLDEALADLDEQLIAGRMTQRVVDVLEAVEIEQGDGYRALVAAGQQTSELLLQGEAIGKTGQRIIMSEPDELLLRPLAVGDVLIGARDAAHAAVEIVHRSGRDPDLDRGAVLAQPLYLQISDGLAAGGPLEQVLRLRSPLRRRQPARQADYL